MQKQNSFRQWAKLIALTGSAQIIVQAIGFLSGILVIRLLPTHEYALYTLANTMLGTMTLLADGGIATGVMSQGGKVWQDRQKLGAVLVTGMQLRKKFAVFSLLVATPALFYLLRQHDASWLMSSLIVLSLIPAFFTSLSGSLLEIAPKLQQDILPLQKIQVIANAGRLALLGLALFIYPFAAVAIASAGCSQIWSNLRLRKIATKYADRNQSPDLLVNSEIIDTVKSRLPISIFYSISGQITIWLLSIFGSTQAVAQVGALGRLLAALTVLNVLLNTLVIPRFTRLPSSSKLIYKRFIQIQCFLFLIGSIFIGITYYFSNEILFILGPNYINLTKEVVLMTILGCLGLITNTTISLNLSRGLIIPTAISISLGIFSQAVFICIFDYSKVYGVIAIACMENLFQAFMHISYFLYRQHKTKPF